MNVVDPLTRERFFFEEEKKARDLGVEKIKSSIEERINPFDPWKYGEQLKKEKTEEEKLRIEELNPWMKKEYQPTNFQPQMDALRQGIMGRMAGRLGVQLPQMGSMGGGFGSGFGQQMGGMGGGGMGMMQPSWMQSYQSPQFPRY
jgi:hypothetical protein